jgi:hypothetical protein
LKRLSIVFLANATKATTFIGIPYRSSYGISSLLLSFSTRTIYIPRV